MLLNLCTALFYLLGVTIVVRGARERFVSRFFFFYSYLIYALLSGMAMLVVHASSPSYYPSVFWFRFLTTVLAEFAVLAEISDHIFSPYPAIRWLGRSITFTLCAGFFILYVLPSLTEGQPTELAIFDLVKRSSLTKALVVIVLLALARHYRLPLGANVAGMMLGFSIYLGLNVESFALVKSYGWAAYGRTLEIMLPLSSTLCLLVWTVALWRYEPVPARSGPFRGSPSGSLSSQLGRFDAVLTRLLRK